MGGLRSSSGAFSVRLRSLPFEIMLGTLGCWVRRLLFVSYAISLEEVPSELGVALFYASVLRFPDKDELSEEDARCIAVALHDSEANLLALSLC